MSSSSVSVSSFNQITIAEIDGGYRKKGDKYHKYQSNIIT